MSHAARIPRAASALLGLLAIAVVGSAPGAFGDTIATVASAGSIPSDAAVKPGELGFEEIVFVKRKPYSSDHYYTDINSGTSPDRFLADNGIYVYNLRTRSERAVVRAADMPGGKGFIGKISLSLDAKKSHLRFPPGSRGRIPHLGSAHRRHGPPPALLPAARRGRESGPLAQGLAHRRHPPLLSAGRQDHLLLDPHASIRSSAAGPPSLWPRVCTAWTPTAATSNS